MNKFRVGKSTARIVLTALALAVGLTVATTATGTASTRAFGPATTSKAQAARAATGATARLACPQPGQRVKTTTSSNVYLIDPNSTANLIPNPTVYFNLWDSWDGISTVGDNVLIDCFHGYFTMSNAHLAKSASSPATYIWDANAGGIGAGGYRHITTAEVFNKYAFSWAKIRTQSAVSPISTNAWNF